MKESVDPVTSTDTQDRAQNQDQRQNQDQDQIKENERRLNCPDCGSKLQKCLIQQNYAIIMCVNTQCSYPLNRAPVIDNLVYVRENDVLNVAKQRLSDS